MSSDDCILDLLFNLKTTKRYQGDSVSSLKSLTHWSWPLRDKHRSTWQSARVPVSDFNHKDELGTITWKDGTERTQVLFVLLVTGRSLPR